MGPVHKSFISMAAVYALSQKIQLQDSWSLISTYITEEDAC